MSLKSHRALAIAGTLAVAALGASSAQAASIGLDLTCDYPLVGTETQHLTISAPVPSTVTAGVPTGPFQVDAVARTGYAINGLYNLTRTATVEGTISPTFALTFPGGNLPFTSDLPFGATAVPQDSSFETDFDYTASGPTPILTFPQAGAGTIGVASVSLNLTARDPEGDPIRLGTDTDSDGSPDTFDVTCTPVAGQNTQLASFTIVSLSPTISSVTGQLRAGQSGTVVIKGTNLKTTTSVTVGGKAGTILSKTAKELVVRLPARPAGTQTLVVENPSGSASTTVRYR